MNQIENMKRILMVAPNSYPIWGAEANVNAKVIKLLSEQGYIIDLVCRPPQIDHYTPSSDALFFKHLNSVHSVIRKTKKDFKTIGLHLRTYLKTGYIYRFCDWVYPAIRQCEILIKENHYDYIYTYSDASELVGLYIAKKYGIKWVATWNDPYIWNRYPEPYGYGVDYPVGKMREKLISEIGRHTYLNAFPSERLRDYMLQYMTNMRIESCVVLPHAVIEELENQELVPRHEILRIIHTGALGRERNPETLVQGISLFIQEHPEAKMELTLLGVFERGENGYLSSLIKRYGLEGFIRMIPPVTYQESLNIAREYDLCLLLEASCKEGIFLPSKVADYMQNHKPIWAVSPQIGVMNDLFNNGEINYFSNVEMANDIKKELEHIYADFEQGNLKCKESGIERFRSKNIFATHLTKIFENDNK